MFNSLNKEEPLCPSCSGSGEGQSDGSLCRVCHGRGTVPQEADTDRDNDYDEVALRG